MTVADDFRSKILALPAEDRAALARELILSLESTPRDENADRAWGQEAERRADAYARGQVTACDWEESVAQVRQALAKRRES